MVELGKLSHLLATDGLVSNDAAKPCKTGWSTLRTDPSRFLTQPSHVLNVSRGQNNNLDPLADRETRARRRLLFFAQPKRDGADGCAGARARIDAVEPIKAEPDAAPGERRVDIHRREYGRRRGGSRRAGGAVRGLNPREVERWEQAPPVQTLKTQHDGVRDAGT